MHLQTMFFIFQCSESRVFQNRNAFYMNNPLTPCVCACGCVAACMQIGFLYSFDPHEGNYKWLLRNCSPAQRGKKD